MGKLFAITGRELRSYFVSPLAYIVGALFLVVSGYLFSLILFSSREASMRSLFENLNIVFLFITPAITMRLLAEERSRGTVELLMTAPVTDNQIVIGKYLASCLYLLFLLALTLIYPAILVFLAKVDWVPIITGYLGIYLLGASFLAVGVLASSLSNSQVIAAIATFAGCLVLWLLPSLTSVFGQQAGQVLEYISVMSHQSNLSRGVIDTTDMLFYASFIGICIYLTIRSVEVYRWR